MRSSHSALTEFFASADIRLDGLRPWDIQVHDDRFYSRVLGGGTLAFGEAYMDGWWDCDALDEMCVRAACARLDERAGWNWRTASSWLVASIFNVQSRRRARIAAGEHYDLGNDFFEAMLDPAMQYSCACFDGTDDLAQAQQNKLELICLKLHLEKGMRLLDIGCGWGGLARHAARHYGCSVVGITLSAEQQKYAAEFCRGLPVEIRLQDYRDVAEPFDRVVSVGMMEHVGHKNYRRYLEAAFRCLPPGGLFLCHTITGCRSRVDSDPWLTRYIFPNSMLPSPAQVARAAEGLFVIEDMHNFGHHYDPTLMAWERRFSRSWPRFRERYGERFRRMWSYYLLSSAGVFRSRTIGLMQFVLAKDGVQGGYVPVREVNAHSSHTERPVESHAGPSYPGPAPVKPEEGHLRAGR